MDESIKFCDGDACGVAWFCDIHALPLSEPLCWKCGRDEKRKAAELKDLY